MRRRARIAAAARGVAHGLDAGLVAAEAAANPDFFVTSSNLPLPRLRYKR